MRLAGALADLGCRVDLLSAASGGPLRGEIAPGVRLLELGARRTLGALPALVRYLRQARPRALLGVQTHANLVALLAGWLRPGQTRVAVWQQSTISMRGRRFPWRPLLPWLVRLAYPRAHLVAAVSHGLAGDVKRFAPRARVEVLFNPVCPRALRDLAQQGPDHAWFGQPLVVSLGRLVPEKDHDTLLRAFAALPPQARLVMAGDGPERPYLERTVAELGLRGRVDLPGFLLNPYRLLSRATVFVLSSRSEGLPARLIEAMALGVPVVATDCAHGPREILRNGRYGTLVPVGDPDALSSALKAALTDPCPPPPESVEAYRPERVAARCRRLLLG